ncbi:MAG: phage terminase large subunit [Deltaproteobacteria bacterium]|nr:phage terminase large subunit [Deltaproteobacteria bacterium]
MPRKSNGDQEEIATTLARIRAHRQELVRRRIVEDGGIDLLASHVLGYEIRPFHAEMLAFQQKARETCLQLAPRGFGKSTLLTITRTIFELVRDPDVRVLIVSNTQNQAENFLREIKLQLQYNAQLKAYFGDFYSQKKWDSRAIWVAPRKRLAKEASVTAVGLGGPVISGHYDVIIADDLVDEESARTEGQRARLDEWFHKSLLPCLEPSGRLYVVGTRYHYLDLYGKLIANTYIDKHQIIRAIERDGSTPWPEKFPLVWLEGRRRKMGTALFNAQYQNDASEMKGSIFREEWIQFYQEKVFFPIADMFVGCDPAATREEALIRGGKIETDYWAIVVGGRERDFEGNQVGPVYVTHVWRGRVTKQEYVNKLMEIHTLIPSAQILVESTGAQEYLIQDLRRHMSVKGITRTKDKVSRAYWLQSHFENGQIHLPSRKLVREREWPFYEALVNELLLFPQGEHDDLFDALETMVEGAMGLHPGGQFSFGMFGQNPRRLASDY